MGGLGELAGVGDQQARVALGGDNRSRVLASEVFTPDHGR